MGSLCTMHNLIQPIQLTGSHEPPDTVQFDVKKKHVRFSLRQDYYCSNQKENGKNDLFLARFFF